ncbi:MAG TPA: bifunctional enoyl-CoA hydratase/phosphate acetyltransferase [Gammaproteobacteria bacterium]|nr:bifunctional enoyl-CoA hydratase/phosphate acetyltransferase [Gammaproteobacteria bacterium]
MAGFMSDWYKKIFKKTRGLAPLVTAIVHPVGEESILGAVSAAQAKIIDPIFVGPKHRILKAAKKCRVDLSNYQIVDVMHSQAAAETAVKLAQTAQVEALMKGEIHTDELMHEVVKKESCLRTARRMSHVFVLEMPYYPKPIFLTDAAINIFPDLFCKKDIVQNAIDLFVTLGYGIPKVAIVSATEEVTKAIPSTLDATALCKMADRGQIKHGILDGPLAFDLAISAESAKIKGIKSAVAGKADIIVVPDIESGNMLYKQMAFLDRVESAGIVLGATIPIVLTSRASDPNSRKASCAIALLYVRRKKIK